MARDTPMSFRAPPDVLALLDHMAGRDQLNTSAWLREAIVILATADLTLPQLVTALGISKLPPAADNRHHRWRSPNPRLGRTVLAATCRHPAHAITKMGTFDRCECGQEFPR
jgi:hypothetical protein